MPDMAVRIEMQPNKDNLAYVQHKTTCLKRYSGSKDCNSYLEGEE